MSTITDGPRSPKENEFSQVMSFLNKNLRANIHWSIDSEYPTALNNVNLHNMRIITENDQVLSHAVLKPLIVKTPHVIFKVGAIGSVVTDQEHRGKGLSTQIIQDCLRLSTEQQCDFAILWTNLYDFYRKMGFELAGSEISFVFEEKFLPPPSDLRFSSDKNISPDAILRLFGKHTVNTVRNLEEIKKYLSIPNTQVYSAWTKDNQLAAFAIEGKGVDLTGYIHEWGGSTLALVSLLSFIRNNRNTNITFLCPKHSVNLISEIEKIPHVLRTDGFLGMIKITQFDQLSAKIKRAFRAEGVSDFVLEKHTNHYVFGLGQELFTVDSEMAITQLLFGPVTYADLKIFSENALMKLNKILPLKLWLWGWDSV